MKDFDREYEYETVDPETSQPTKLTIRREDRLKAERTFRIGGEEFSHRVGVAPEVLHPWLDASEAAETEEEWLKVLDETVVAMLDPGQDELWHKVRSQEAENPITQLDLSALMRWLVEVTTGRPTGEPSGSSSTQKSSGTSSTADSSSRVPTPA